MEVTLTRIIEALLLPPGGPLLLAAAGLLLRRPAGRTVAAAGLLLLYLFALPPVAEALLRSLERYPPLQTAQIVNSGAGAIVVLGAGRYERAPEYGGEDTASRYALERLRYAAHLHRASGLPVVVSGGAPWGERVAEATLLRRTLADYGVERVWEEGASATTGANALWTARLLADAGIRRALLVTHAWHMERAVAVFRRTGLEVIPAPTAFTTGHDRPLPLRLLPDARALLDSRVALHEYLGQIWYRLRY